MARPKVAGSLVQKKSVKNNSNMRGKQSRTTSAGTQRSAALPTVPKEYRKRNDCTASKSSKRRPRRTQTLSFKDSIIQFDKTSVEPTFRCNRCKVAVYDDIAPLKLHLNHCPFVKPFRTEKIKSKVKEQKASTQQESGLQLSSTNVCSNCKKVYKHRRSLLRHVKSSHRNTA